MAQSTTQKVCRTFPALCLRASGGKNRQGGCECVYSERDKIFSVGGFGRSPLNQNVGLGNSMFGLLSPVNVRLGMFTGGGKVKHPGQRPERGANYPVSASHVH